MRKKTAPLIVILYLLIPPLAGLVSAQGPRTDGPPLTVQEMVAEARAGLKALSPADVKQVLDRKEPVVILDVRDPWEYAGGHLPGAVNISRGTLEFKVRDKLPELGTKIIVYCLTVGRAALSGRTLQALGYQNVLLLDAPLEEWLQAGYPLEK